MLACLRVKFHLNMVAAVIKAGNFATHNYGVVYKIRSL
ncbi:hypothetical protein B0G73_101114 [Paraburkholderia sp. BL25I1N1]|nr:hypothetical protein B0G73_101114 [Paraburkholderia sp. BL25I1N1]